MMEPEEEHGEMVVPLDHAQSTLELQHGNSYDHDQLPDVEEYKASIGHRSGTGSSGLKQKIQNVIGGRTQESNGDAERVTLMTARDPIERKQDPPEMINQQPEYQVDENEGIFRIDDVEEEEGLEQHPLTSLEIEQEEDEDKLDGDQNKCFWKSCGLICLFLLTAVLVQLFVFGTELPKPVPADFFHFVKGNTDEYFAIRNYVVNVAQISAEAAFDQTTTPQYLAAQWMAHGDPAQKSVPQLVDLAFTERYIMVVLFFAFGGTEWSHQYNFLSGDHICTWFQEFTLRDGSSVMYGIHRCKTGENGQLYPHSVFMPNNGLSGFIPDEIKGLERLEKFNVMFNPNIVGTLPEAFAGMVSLTHLGLQWCNLDGTIPTWIGDMTSLEYLGLGNNLLDGKVPAEIAKLQRLELLGLDDNDLIGGIDTFAPLTSLKSLYLENNYIDGEITEELLQGWPKMEELDVSECSLFGGLPPTLFNQNPNLEVLDLHGNQFEGPFPDFINTNNKLEFLAIHNNKLDGFIPESIRNLKVLRHLDLSENKFAGSLPEVMGEMTALDYLFTASNDFAISEVPKFLIELTNLKELSMKKNQLEGSIPQFFEYLSNLVFLDFHDNSLDQQIPTGFGKLTSLRHLILKMNALTGQLPAEMGQMTNLQVFLMEQNNFDGDAEAICSVTTFTVDTFVADCGDEFVYPPSDSPVIDDNPNAGGNPPSPVAEPTQVPIVMPVTNPTQIPIVMPVGPPSTSQSPATMPATQPTQIPIVMPVGPPSTSQNPIVMPVAGPTPDSIPSFDITPIPTRIDDDKVFTSSPTTSLPVFDDDGPPFPNPTNGGDTRNNGGRRRLVGGKISCSCCTVCCDPGDFQCNNWDWKGNLDPIWEHGYKRQRYSYDLGPVVWLP